MQPDELITLLLKNRGLTNPGLIEEFFHPLHPDDISLLDLNLDLDLVTAASDLIRSHINSGHKIFIYGDYDVDGLCATAVMWEAIHSVYSGVLPHIPHRREEGYGLSRKGIDHCLSLGAKLIITVDNGIVAHEQVAYCQSKNCDLIIIDHHEPLATLPPASVILHSTATTAAGLAWFFSREFSKIYNLTPKTSTLELVALSVICDIIPLLGINRSLAKFGLEALNRTSRPGLLALMHSANIFPSPEFRRGDRGEVITSYHAGFIVGPRLNAMGRLEHAIDSLRLLCTTNPDKAASLARSLGDTNRSRQDLTLSAFTHAQTLIDENNLPPLIIVADTSYDEGIIGLIAGKLAEKYHRPAIAIAIGESISKGSARSLPGFNITDHLRSLSDLLLSVGGHAGAAGFSLNNQILDKFILAVSHPVIDPKIFVNTRRIDAKIPLATITYNLITKLQDFEPYGLCNPQPVFTTSNIQITGISHVGRDRQHLKFRVDNLEAIWFNIPNHYNLEPSTSYDIIYKPTLNIFNGRSSLQLIIQDIIPHAPAS